MPCSALPHLQGLQESRSASAAKAKQLTFELFFPRPPYFGAQYRAARGKVLSPPPAMIALDPEAAALPCIRSTI